MGLFYNFSAQRFNTVKRDFLEYYLSVIYFAVYLGKRFRKKGISKD